MPSDRTIGQDKAHGEVIITSQRPAAFTLPKGATVRVDGGPKFVTDQDLALAGARPGAGRHHGRSTPARPATSRPARSRSSTAAASTQLGVTNQRPTTGGTDRQAKVVTDDDRKTLDDMLKKDARDKGFAQLQQQAGTEQTLPDASLSLDVARREVRPGRRRRNRPADRAAHRQRVRDGLRQPGLQRPGRQGARAERRLGPASRRAGQGRNAGRAEGRRAQSRAALRRVGSAAEHASTPTASSAR